MKADICFIGGGLNYAGAVVAAKAGLDVVLIEKDLNMLGGTCLNKGCIPSKMFLHFANVVRESEKDVFSKRAVLDMKKLLEKKNFVIKNARDAIFRQCKNVKLIEGRGEIIEKNRVRVKDEEIEAKYIVIGTGSYPFIPENIEYDGKNIVTSDEILQMQSFPKEIAIYGNGAIGLEMASFFASVGVKTYLIYRHERIFSKAHPYIDETLKSQMLSLGVKLMPQSPIKRAKFENGKVVIEFENSSLETEKLLVATGRKADVSAVGNSKDIELYNKGILTDDFFETTLKNHFAVGDCNGKLQLAHAARAEVLNVVGTILGKKPKTLNLFNVVKFIHTLPMSYASVGLTKTELEKRGEFYKESIVPLKAFTYPLIQDSKDGAVIIYSDKEGFILGGEILSKDAEELIGIISMAIAGEMDAKTARRTILAHPTLSESVEKGFYRA